MPWLSWPFVPLVSGMAASMKVSDFHGYLRTCVHGDKFGSKPPYFDWYTCHSALRYKYKKIICTRLIRKYIEVGKANNQWQIAEWIKIIFDRGIRAKGIVGENAKSFPPNSC